MVRLVKVDVSVERYRTHCGHDEEEIERKNEEHHSCDKNRRDKKIWGALLGPIIRRHQMTPGIIGVVKSDVVPKEGTTDPMMTEAIVQEGLASQMSADRDQGE